MSNKLIEQINFKADGIPTNTKENRRAKGVYIDCLMMAKEYFKYLNQEQSQPVSDEWVSKEDIYNYPEWLFKNEYFGYKGMDDTTKRNLFNKYLKSLPLPTTKREVNKDITEQK